jgi:hypothetical protein
MQRAEALSHEEGHACRLLLRSSRQGPVITWVQLMMQLQAA